MYVKHTDLAQCESSSMSFYMMTVLMVTPTSVLAESSKSYPFLCSPEHIAGLRKYLVVCICVCVCACFYLSIFSIPILRILLVMEMANMGSCTAAWKLSGLRAKCQRNEIFVAPRSSDRHCWSDLNVFSDTSHLPWGLISF